MLRTKVPYLTSAQLDQAVAELLRNYGHWRGAPVRPPIDVDEIAEGYLGLTLELTDLRQLLGVDDVLGATWFDERLMRVDQSLEGQEGRFAFTVAHEIAHWQLHRPLCEMEKMSFARFSQQPGAKPTAAIVCGVKDRKSPAEWQADQFAARLLMPASHVRDAAQRVSGRFAPAWDGLEASRKAGVLDFRLRSFAGDVIGAGDFSNVSNEAMCYRLLDLKLVSDQPEPQARLF
jgi:Zn-dependent peptidase ImmA (M78 family)